MYSQQLIKTAPCKRKGSPRKMALQEQVTENLLRLGTSGRRDARITGTRANQLLPLVLLKRMPNPAYRTPERKQGEASTRGQL